MKQMDRRGFIGTTAAGAAVLAGAAGCGRQIGLDDVLLRSVADAVLPSELTSEGTTRIAGDFVEWVAGHATGAELNHAYGSGDLAFVDDLPITKWSEQLLELDRRAQDRFSRTFVESTTEDRRLLIREVLQTHADARLGNPIQAEHIAIAVLSFFCRSSEATDLAYRVSIKKQQCRPLDDSPNQPIALG